MNNETKTLKIDYSLLMDLRIDYAFKILFYKGRNTFANIVAKRHFCKQENLSCDKIFEDCKSIFGQRIR